MGRRPMNRKRVTVMIDRRLLRRVDDLAARHHGGNRSEALNQMLWAGVFGRANLAEKYDFRQKWDKMSEFVKSFIDNYL